MNRERAKKALCIAAAILCLTPLFSPAIALAVGVAIALTVENSFTAISKYFARLLLQSCVILLGFSMNLFVVFRAGREGFLLAAATILITFTLGLALAKILRVPRLISTLISAGTAICGGSAIAAVGSVTGAVDGEMSVAMGTIFLLNAVALYLFPLLGHAFHLNAAQYGTWAGMSIHDISSVVGATAPISAAALQTATAVKLSRALWIIPVALAAAFAFHKRPIATAHTTIGFDPAQTAPAARGKLQIPWFIGAFLLASLLRTLITPVADLAPIIAHVTTAGFTLTLFLIGANLSRKTLAAVGWRPLVQGILLWIVVSGLSLFAVMHWVR